MADDRTYYVICADNCKFEGMTKEQIFAAIAEATGATPTDVDSAFISKIKEINKGATVQIWQGTTAEYNEVVANGEKSSDVIYIVTDNTRVDDIENDITALQNDVAENKKQITEIDELLTYVNSNGLIFRKILTADDDLDNIIENGIYAYSTASMPANSPFENAAVIEVVGTNNSKSQKIQRAYRYGVAGCSAFRPLYDGKWGKWKKNTIHYSLTATSVNAIPTFTDDQTAARLFADLENENPVSIAVTITSAIGASQWFFTPIQKLTISGKTAYTLICNYITGQQFIMTLTDSEISEISTVEPYAAFVVETGTTEDGWNYRKWSDGTAECWGRQFVTCTPQTEGSFNGAICCLYAPDNLFVDIDSAFVFVQDEKSFVGYVRCYDDYIYFYPWRINSEAFEGEEPFYIEMKGKWQ